MRKTISCQSQRGFCELDAPLPLAAQGELRLVFARIRPMLSSMGFSSWCRRVLNGASALHSAVVPAPAEMRTAAEAGDPEAQSTLALSYRNSANGSPEMVKAVEWFRKAARQNHLPAQYNLGLMLANGLGAPRDDAEALVWIRKAAESGHPGAQHNLGMRFHRISVHHAQMDAAESRIEAFKWFCLAAAQDFQGSAAACERVTLSMSFAEVADGRKRSAAFSELFARRPSPVGSGS